MNYYKKIAGIYDSKWKAYTDHSLHKIIARLPASLEGKRILDYGCGTGELIRRLVVQQPTLAHITGYDPVEEMLEQAREKIRQLPGELQEKVTLQSTHEYNYKFDLILSTSVLHYLPQPEDTLRFLNSLLMKGGMLVLLDYTKDSFPAKYFEWFIKRIDTMHQKAYKPQQIKAMVQNSGFKVLNGEEFNITPLWKGYVVKATV